MRHGRALLPAFAVTALLLAAGCSSPAPHAEGPTTGRGGRAEVTSDPTAAPDQTLTVTPAGTIAPTATAGPAGSGSRAHRTTLAVSSYDSRTRRAVISGRPHGSTPTPGGHTPRPTPAPASPTATPTVSPPASPSGAPHRAAVGDVIASAPAPGAPHGLLARVTKVLGDTGRGTEVQTEPATLNAVLGDDSAKGTVPVAPSAFTVDKLLPDVKVSWSTSGEVHVGPEGAKVPLGSLRLDVGAKVPAAKGAPVSAGAAVSGFVQVAPEVDFSYGGSGTAASPGSAYLGVSGDWASRWHVEGRAAAATGTPLRIPFARLHADPVLQVGPVPVVVNLDLTCYLQISGDGHISVDVAQHFKGDFTAGGTFSPAKGWTPVSSSHMTGTPVQASVTTAGHLKTALGAEASVGLYGAVGVTADLAPYLRGEASGTVTASSDRPRAKTGGAWGVYGGVDLSGTLRLQLSVFGTPVFQRSLPLGTLHREWKLAGGTL
ncbi:hypothetical protein [Streptomyces sp. L2]|uniref:hypothetical protein n=1 Tax=Streptomyces sp. L2 TaxID=2162665 RepID=UPI0010123AA7|nr:hypothetical protein [Streptomyces sp. L2]